MSLSRHTKLFWSLLMSILLTNVPHAVASEIDAMEMVSTTAVVDEMSRMQAEEKVRDVLAREDVRKELSKYGVSTEEVSKRVAGLSDQELKRLAHQMDQARAGGDLLIGVLVVVVLVLLILFLVKRI